MALSLSERALQGRVADEFYSLQSRTDSLATSVSSHMDALSDLITTMDENPDAFTTDDVADVQAEIQRAKETITAALS